MIYVIKLSDLKGWLSVRLVELVITTVISKFYEAVRAEVACQRYASPYSISLSLSYLLPIVGKTRISIYLVSSNNED